MHTNLIVCKLLTLMKVIKKYCESLSLSCIRFLTHWNNVGNPTWPKIGKAYSDLTVGNKRLCVYFLLQKAFLHHELLLILFIYLVFFCFFFHSKFDCVFSSVTCSTTKRDDWGAAEEWTASGKRLNWKTGEWLLARREYQVQNVGYRGVLPQLPPRKEPTHSEHPLS